MRLNKYIASLNIASRREADKLIQNGMVKVNGEVITNPAVQVSENDKVECDIKTYKDDKIQKTTTTPDFADIDKSTYKPTKRDSIRFAVKQGDGYVNISNKKKKKEENKRIISIENISRGGLAVVHDGSLKKGERFVIDLDYHNIKASPEVEVVRVSNDRAGLKFINMDNATANKILYINLFAAQDNTDQTSENKATMVIEKL